MRIETLSLQEFRTYESLTQALPPEGLRIIGDNASGKSSFIEAIVMLAVTKSQRAVSDRDSVRWSSGDDLGVPPYATIDAEIQTRAGERSLSMSIELPPGTTRIARKKFRLDGKAVRAHDMVGVLRVVVFSPEDVHIVTGTPAQRRRQLDIFLSQMDRQYMRCLGEYGKVLAQRNTLLKRFANEGVSPNDRMARTELSFWDDEMIRNGAFLMASRYRGLARLDEVMRARSEEFIGEEVIGVSYVPHATMAAQIDDDRLLSTTSAALLDELETKRLPEFRRGASLFGPQRDDFTFTINDRSLAQFGSRGQQRLGVIALKMAEGDVMSMDTGDRPVILLDDVLSELDDRHRDLLLSAIRASGSQTIITSATERALNHPAIGDLDEVRVVDGGFVGV